MKNVVWRTFSHSLAFVLGFSAVFILVFGLPATFISRWISTHGKWIGYIGGAVLIILGIHIAGSLWGITPFKFLLREKALHLSSKPSGYIGSFLVGVFFSAGWTPCVGPILAAILTLTATQGTSGVLMMTAYSLGLAVPFLLASLAFNGFLSILPIFRRAIPVINVFCGVLLIAVGVLLMFGLMSRLNAYAGRLTSFSGEAWLSGQSVNLIIAFLGGILSFLSPCVLPMVPSYIFYVTGLTFSDLEPKKA